jgi:nucleotide-binding universal stress UspA family protein
LKALQKFFDATLHILHINTPVHFKRDAEAHEAMVEFAKHYKLANYKLHFRSYENEGNGIIDFAYTEKMDLIAMATHARKGLAHVFNSSMTESVVNHIQVPIWTYCIKG